MTKRFYSILLTVSVALLFFECSNGVSGNTSETTNGTAVIQGVVLNEQGVPLNGASIQLIDNRNWIDKISNNLSVILNSTKSAANGSFTLTIDSSDCNLQIDSDSGAQLVYTITPTTVGTIDTFIILPTASIHGSLDTSAAPPAILYLSGSSYTATPNSSLFEFPAIASGVYTLVAPQATIDPVPAIGNSIAPVAGAATDAGTLILDPQVIVIDDCPDTSFATSLSRITNKGFWYDATDEIGSPATKMSITTVNGANAYAGLSRHAGFRLGSETDAWGMAGCYLGDDQGHDLSTLEVLSFYYKSTTSINLTLFSLALDSIAGNTSHFEYQLPAQSSWTKMEIPITSFTLNSASPAALAGKTWADAASSILALRYMVYSPILTPGDTADIYIDNLVLKGIDLTSFMP